METQNAPKNVFKIEKDPEKQNFISSHTYDNIPSFGLGKNPLFDSIININRKNLNYLNISNSNSDCEIRIKENKNEELKLNETNNKIKLKVILNYAYLKDYFIFNLPTKIIYNKEQNLYQFNLNSIINIIHNYSNDKNIFLNENYSISYYTNDENSNLSIDLDEEKEEDIKPYYFVGNFPLNKNINYLINIPSDGILYLKFRKRISKVKSLRYDIFEEENEEEIEENNGNEELVYNTKSKRAKEKKIGYIIKKVFEWKGFRKYTDNKMSLIEAAKKVGLSKKTLDEYFNQIREGKKYNFDFNKHKKDKVNILRGYVKKMSNNNNLNNKEKEEKKEKKVRIKNKK